MSKKSTTTKSIKKSTISVSTLMKWNKAMMFLHFVQAIAVLVLSRNSNGGISGVTTNYLTLDTLRSTDKAPVLVSATRHLFDINLAYIVAAFFLLSALAHLFVVTRYKKRYAEDLEKGINRVRWFEYSLSASVMMVGIALLSGIFDLSSLIMIFVLDLLMNMMGLVMELWNQGKTKPNWLSYILGCVAGITPWIVFVIYILGVNAFGSGQIPTFVYYIYGSMFLFFNSFAVNMYLQYKKKGRWSNYLYGEKVYMILSLVAKSLLAWQVFAGTLRP
jgi:Heliorhodopsin